MDEHSADSEAQRLAIRDRYRRKRELQMTPEERLQRMEALQDAAFKLLASSPEAYAAYRRRNYKKRAVPHCPSKPHPTDPTA